MDRKRLAIAPRRKAVSTALMYGLSLTVRFTSPTADEAPPQIAQDAKVSTSILIDPETTPADSFLRAITDLRRRTGLSSN